MSFLSRLFRKAPTLSPTPVAAPQQAPASKTEKALPKAGAEQRALAAAAEESALQAALDARDMQAVARWVIAGSSTKIRQTAAEAIEEPELLRQLIRDVRGGNDKTVYKILTAKRDLRLEQVRKLEQRQAEIAAAASALERHSQRAYDIAFSARLDQFEREWEALAPEAGAAQRLKVQQCIVRARETIAEHLRKAAEQAQQALAAANAASEARRVRETRAAAAATAAAEQVQLGAAQKQVFAEQQQAEQQALRHIGGLIKKARDALSDGSSSRAAGVRRAIDEALAGGKPLPAHLASQIQQLDAQLDALKGWKSFSVTPKRAELIEEMELLLTATLDPTALAERIRSLQDEWRTLSKGVDESLEAEWQRFHAAAEKAYQPCREYFAAQALVRAENLRHREALLHRLTTLETTHDWQQPDWRSVIKALSETKPEWYRHSPVERQAGRQQQEAFEAVRKSLQARLDAEYTRNQQQKEALIERAKALLASDDIRKAIDGVKELQQQWRVVGLVPRDVDQRLWSSFREHCDAVFQKRQQESADQAAGLENNKARAVSLCEQIEAIAELEGPELLDSASSIAELRGAFEALGEFPRADTRELRNRFERAQERCKAAFTRQHARNAEHAWGDLFNAANQLRAYRLALAQSADAEQLEALKATAEACIESVPQWPKGGLEALRQGLAAEPSADLAANEAALRLLCIRAELLSDQPTPAEDLALRREMQLQRLVQSMGQGVKADESHLDALTIEWVAVGPVAESGYLPLVERFRRCRERGIAKSR